MEFVKFVAKKDGRQPDHKHPANKVGLVRYRKEQWTRWLETVDDREKLEKTHEEWQRKAEAMADRLKRAGLQVIWVEVVPDEMARWCAARGYKNNAEARSLFAAESIGNIIPPQAK